MALVAVHQALVKRRRRKGRGRAAGENRDSPHVAADRIVKREGQVRRQPRACFVGAHTQAAGWVAFVVNTIRSNDVLTGPEVCHGLN